MAWIDDDIKQRQSEKEKDHLNLQKRNISDIKKLLKLPEFRRFAWRVLSETGIFRASISTNAMQTAFCEGRRDVGLSLLADINESDISAFAQMQREYVSEAKSKEALDNKEKE